MTLHLTRVSDWPAEETVTRRGSCAGYSEVQWLASNQPTAAVLDCYLSRLLRDRAVTV